jgi:hypothetical protein
MSEKENQSDSSGSDGTVESQPQPPAPAPAGLIPNGGLQAWFQVLGAFFLFFNSW